MSRLVNSLIVVALCAGAAGAIETRTFPPAPLRGYGSLSGELWTSPDGATSTLRITCDNADKAKIVRAKFLSDLGLLPGVKSISLKTGARTLTGRSVAGQGGIVAIRSGRDVLILAAADEARLPALCDQRIGRELKVDATEPETAVPMFLDRWDRYGFRFYYYPWQRPRDAAGKELADYDPLPEFDFAKQRELGFVFWQTPHALDSAEGLLNTSFWDWGLQRCRTLKLPVGINTDLGKPSPLLNRYREQTIQRMPQYIGGFYGLMNYDEGIPSWNAPELQEAVLAQIQQTVRRFNGVENVVNWLEPHGEMYHGPCDALIDYGPVADAGFREFLRETYGEPAAVARRWLGDAAAIKSWEEIRVPELASFLGWGPEAVDLTGSWRISYDAARDASSAAPALDDSAWPTVTAPGHDIVMLLPRKPAILRRKITIDRAWRSAHPRVWLYVWDMNDTRSKGNDVLAFVNGKPAVETRPSRVEGHWMGVEVSDTLTAGENLIAVVLPQGRFGYRAYFSPQPPRQYPELGERKNAQWADFTDWLAWSRLRTLRRGTEMIRQADPDRPIVFMHPDMYAAGTKQICRDFGGIFHNTGYMAAFWTDLNSMQARSIGLPTDLEPGSGAKDIPEFKKFLGLWSTEGIQGVDYFIHIGDILWHNEIRAYFDKTLNLWRLMGKYHVPKAQVAVMVSDRTMRIMGFPWENTDPNVNLAAGEHHWRVGDRLLAEYERDAVDEGDFQSGNASQYRVVIDTNTSIMDEPLLANIEKWVSSGGIFVTFIQTGRHTSSQQNAWPISKLTGYAVTSVDRHGPDGNALTPRHLVPAPGQEIFKGQDWPKASNYANGLTLKKQQADCQDLMLWPDGSTAVGMRRIGKGAIIHVGAKWADDRGARNPEATSRLFSEIIQWAGIKRIPAATTPSRVLMRRYVSNNGLYDVWVLWNDSNKPATTSLIFRDGLKPASALEVTTYQPVPLQSAGGETNAASVPGGPQSSAAATRGTTVPAVQKHGPPGVLVSPGEVRLADLQFEPLETRAFLTPRNQITAAPARWLELQRSWWRGTAAPGKPMAIPQPKFAMDFSDDWAFKPLDAAPADEAALAAADLDDSKWERMRFGIVSLPDHPGAHHGIFRKRFIVPAGWTHGRVMLWVQSWSGTTFSDTGRVYLDGKALRDRPLADGIAGDDLTDTLKPGSSHVLAVILSGKGSLLGPRGATWLAYVPDPAARQDLSGDWAGSPDGLKYGAPAPLTEKWAGLVARRTVRADASQAGKNVVIHASARPGVLQGVIVNGHYVMRFHHRIGTDIDLNVTPWIRFGQDNEIILVATGGTSACGIRNVELRYYDRDVYP
ncbi:MAG: hypothetical protein ACHRHE_01820 [Tepidisphaerales bacterium]